MSEKTWTTQDIHQWWEERERVQFEREHKPEPDDPRVAWISSRDDEVE